MHASRIMERLVFIADVERQQPALPRASTIAVANSDPTISKALISNILLISAFSTSLALETFLYGHS